MTIIESPHALGFMFDQEYYIVNVGRCVLVEVKRRNGLFNGGFSYEFKKVN